MNTKAYEIVDSVEKLQETIAQAGPFAGAVYFMIQLLTVIFAPIPSNVSMLAGALVMAWTGWDLCVREKRMALPGCIIQGILIPENEEIRAAYHLHGMLLELQNRLEKVLEAMD